MLSKFLFLFCIFWLCDYKKDGVCVISFDRLKIYYTVMFSCSLHSLILHLYLINFSTLLLYLLLFIWQVVAADFGSTLHHKFKNKTLSINSHNQIATKI